MSIIRLYLISVSISPTQKEEKPLQHKVQNSVTDFTPVQSPLPPKPSSPDVLKASTASMATISNINIDVQLQHDEDVIKGQVQESQSVLPVPQAVNESQIEGGWKPDPSCSLSPAKLPPKSVAGGEERRESNGLLHMHPADIENPGETFPVLRDNQKTDVDDTFKLLKEADMHNLKLEIKKEMRASSVSERKPQPKFSVENIRVSRDMEQDNENDTVTLLKGALTQHRSSDVQVSAPIERVTSAYVYKEIFL